MSLANAYLDQLSEEEIAHLERLIARFEVAWQRGERPGIDDYLPAEGVLRRAAELELIHLDLEYGRGAERPLVADYLRRYPELRQDPNAVRGLMAAEQEFRRDESERPATVPEQLGKFRLLGLVGAGACGTVYRAVDTELGRTVAVKVPHWSGREGREEVERFLREARAAATLRHPGIVAVHDVTEWEGIRFLVSEFVPGQTLAARLAAGRPGFREAAELLARAADALHHAHQHGVVHRDLKPSNLLIDEIGQPRLVDFGLARCEAAENTLTVEGELLGTPAYMSPEQARGEAHRVDGRSDVWSLGVILYELLTGERPFWGSSRMVLRQVLDEEPRPPRRVNDEVPRDLETICLKALAKEPAGRYPTAHELAEDLRRFLRGEPVRARPVGAVDRLWRWCRRRPLVAGLAAGLVLVTVVGFAGILAAWREADGQRRQAEENLVQAEHQRLQAEKNLLQAYQAMQAMTAATLRAVGRDSPAGRAVARELWAQRLKYYESILEQYAGDPTLQSEASRARFRVAFATLLACEEEDAEKPARYEKALGLLRQLTREHPDAAEYHGELGHYALHVGYAHVGRKQYAQGLSLYREGRDHLRLAIQRPPPAPGSLLPWVTEGHELRYRRALARTCMLLGNEERRSGLTEEARRSYREAGAAYEQLVREKANDPVTLYGLATSTLGLVQLEQQSGSADTARALYQRLARPLEECLSTVPVVAEPEPTRQLAQTWYCLGKLHEAFQKLGPGASACQRAAALCEPVLRAAPGNSRLRGLLAKAGLSAGYQHRKGGKPEEALVCFRLVRTTLEKCAQTAPLERESLHQLAEACQAIGSLQKVKQPEEAAVAARRAGELFEQLASAEPNNAALQRTLGGCLHLLGDVQRVRQQWEEAARAFKRAADVRERLVPRYPDDLVYRNDAHWSWQVYGEMLERLDQRDAAAAACRQAVGHLQELVRRAPRHEEYRRRLTQRRDNLVRLLRELGRADEADILLR